MGYMRHHAIIVTGYADLEFLGVAHAKAKEIFGQLVSPIVEAKINLYGSFMVGPDGSKEGWDLSDDHNALRDLFLDSLKGEWLSWAEIQYGDEDGVNMILRTDHDPEA